MATTNPALSGATVTTTGSVTAKPLTTEPSGTTAANRPSETTTRTASTTAPKPSPFRSPSSPAMTATQADAFTTIKTVLDTYGLGSLAAFVRNEIIKGRTDNEILLDIRATPEFKARFPAIAARTAAGLPALSPGDYVNYEAQATQMMRAAGLPKGFYDSPQDFTTLLSGDVSLSELNDRIDAAKTAAFNLPQEAQARLVSEFGMAPGSGSLAAIFLDPNKAVPLLQRDLMAAQIGGRADQIGFAGLSNDQAQSLATNGVTDAQAQQGFAQLTHERELMTGLPGSNEAAIGTQTQLGATFLGNAASQDVIERRRASRIGAFKDTGGFAATQKGEIGLTSADS